MSPFKVLRNGLKEKLVRMPYWKW